VQGLLFIACCFLLFLFVPVLLFLLTYVFRQSCVLCGLPKPSVLGAAGIMLVTVVSVGVAESVMGEIVRLAGERAGLPRWESGIVTFFLALPIDLLISSAIHAGLMGIRFGKGIEVWFVQRLIYLTLLAAVVFVAAVVYLIRTMNG
jgi:hypothetical protein